MPDIPGKPQKPEKVVEQIVTSEVTSRKKPLIRRLRELLIGGDSKTVVGYVISDVLVPQAKDMLTEAVTSGFQRLVYGDSTPPSRYGRRPTVGSGPTNYTSYSARGNNPVGRYSREDRPSTATVRSQSVEEMIFATRVEAEAVLERMYDLLENYEQVSVHDLKSLIGRTPIYTDQKWGWVDLQGSSIRIVRGNGYALILPDMVSL